MKTLQINSKAIINKFGPNCQESRPGPPGWVAAAWQVIYSLGYHKHKNFIFISKKFVSGNFEEEHAKA